MNEILSLLTKVQVRAELIQHLRAENNRDREMIKEIEQAEEIKKVKR